MNFILLYLLWYTAVIKVEAVVNRFGPGDGFMCHCNDTAEQCDKKSGACQSGCNQEWFGPGCQYRDLAQLQGKTVSQTTDGKSRSAMLAIDNNDNTCSRSGKQGGFINWKIKLPQNETLTELYIRTKKGRLVDFTNYAVYVEYAPQMGEHVTEQCYRANKQRPKSEYFVIRCDRPLIGNQVRIQVEDTDRLVLCDVKINGGRNLAFGKQTYQSSTLYKNSNNYGSLKAVDGDIESESHTEKQMNALWKLTLGHCAVLQHLYIIYGRGSSQQHGISLINDGEPVPDEWMKDEYKSLSTRSSDGISVLSNNQEATGINIQSKTNAYVVLKEVEFYGDCSPSYCGFDCKTVCSCKDPTIWDRMSNNCTSVCDSSSSDPKCQENEDSLSTCDNGFYGTSCTKCGHCSGNRVCDKKTGECPYGCQSGYTGTLCNEACREHCKDNTCEQSNGNCIGGCKDGWQGDKCENKCSDGTYGHGCRHTCSPNCKTNQCHHVTGRCEQGCKDGWHDDYCKFRCQQGTYGRDCQGRCSKNCATLTCNHISGKCNGCKNGWQGDRCQDTCQHGTYGRDCKSQCSKNCATSTCNYISGKCDSCKIGWQGDWCRDKCSGGKYGNGCSHTCSPNCKTNQCHHETGRCEQGCKDGWHGDYCRSECSDHCRGHACRQANGHCIDGCTAGWFGDECEKKCSDHCQRRTCRQANGHCIDGCTAGWFGDECEKKCSDGNYGRECKNKCSGNCIGGNSNCNHVNGHCSRGCIDGWRGSLCNQACFSGTFGSNCEKRCNVNCEYGTCDHVNGKCDRGCKDGWRGDYCSDPCRFGTFGSNCDKRCDVNCEHGACDHINGKCERGCKDGWRGDYCSDQCSDGNYGRECKNQCSGNCIGGNSNCNHVNGHCSQGCVDGWRGSLCNQECEDGSYGIRCENRCSKNCWGGKKYCNHINGYCKHGCTDGWQGDLCDQVCHSGTFGTNCSKRCNFNCKRGTCDHISGKCDSGCKDGWYGSYCEDECEDGSYGLKCQNTCSGNCLDGNKYCNHVNGHCEHGCSDGWQGNLCDEVCHSGTFGTNCSKRCNFNCKSRICDHISGKCDGVCKDGWYGDYCENVCSAGLWGDGCNNSCGNCSNGTCDHVNGHCKSGFCSPGFIQTSLCNQECEDGLYGDNCTETCGYCHNGTACEKSTGACLNDCLTGYTGTFCKIALVKTGTTLPLIGAGLFLILLMLTVLFVVFWTKKMRLRTGKYYSDGDVRESKKGGHQAVTIEDVSDNSSLRSGVQISNLLQYVKQCLANKDTLIAEYQSIPYGLHYSTDVARLPTNSGKNRYKEIYPYDHSRVVLSTLQGIHTSDYINASIIQGHSQENAYIASQGPTESTFEDFWRMIWEKRVQIIVMLTNLVEEMKVKCHQYWGNVNTEAVFGHFTVCTESENVSAECTVRRFKICYQKRREDERTVTQFHYTAWPDKGVPRSTTSLVQFWNVVRQADTTKLHPWLVHCSAGVGRTGTFIAMDILHDEGEEKNAIDIKQCVLKLRQQRLNMVQTKEQYKFLHGLVVELLVFPSKPVKLEEFGSVFDTLKEVDSRTNKSRLLLQYEGLREEVDFMNLVYDSCRLQTDTDIEDRFAAAKLDANISKNRYKTVLAANEFRPFLASSIPGCTNYINAVYLPSFCNPHGFILTQTPLKETAIDCCRLVVEEGIKVIVTLDYNAKGIENVGEYLPEDGSLQLGPFTCMKLEEHEKSTHLHRIHQIVHETKEYTVNQLIFKKWPPKSVIPSDTDLVLAFLQEVEFCNRKENGQSILVQCLNGAERSGLFAMLMKILECIRYENRVSIPLLIRLAKIRREQIIPNFEQYKFCHDMLQSFFESNSTYANI